jgi:Chaperone of endosialidase
MIVGGSSTVLSVNQRLTGFVGALALAGAAYAQQPPDSVSGDAYGNTAMGVDALIVLTADCTQFSNCGQFDTAAGYQALYYNTAGGQNTATGYQTLYYNTSGSYNTGTGVQALYFNTTGMNNTATGFAPLYKNTTGSNNTASGYEALDFNTTGSNNTATGFDALRSNTTGNWGTAAGDTALYKNTTGVQNTGSGAQALYTNTTGGGNTASGVKALYNNTVGFYNIAEGWQAGINLTTGNYNIDIGNAGVAGESATVRIGTAGQQNQTFIAGINNATVTGAAVVVDPMTGQLGVLASSERFKTAIEPMGSNTAKLEQLRPVTFKLKSDLQRTRQYGLIAEEVAQVYPELVIRDATGRINGVRYDELAPMLLNEMQRQQDKIAMQAVQMRELRDQLDKQLVTQKEQILNVQQQLTTLKEYDAPPLH